MVALGGTKALNPWSRGLGVRIPPGTPLHLWGNKVLPDLDKRIQTLARWMFEAKHPVVFTGAGISTESGLHDFRGPNGIWTRQAKGLTTKPRPFDSAEPNTGHMAIVELQELGKLDFLISQNVDNLHLKSGIRPDVLAELHGNVTKLRCTHCQTTYDKSYGLDACPCGGELVCHRQSDSDVGATDGGDPARQARPGKLGLSAMGARARPRWH